MCHALTELLRRSAWRQTPVCSLTSWATAASTRTSSRIAPARVVNDSLRTVWQWHAVHPLDDDCQATRLGGKILGALKVASLCQSLESLARDNSLDEAAATLAALEPELESAKAALQQEIGQGLVN